ncbi:hypothetical protein Tco_1080895 [Tanacetum coccineum]|uniref:Uncharacterized protein n=1 Tax=Tanacetum coccineum TaxID=301880 RepID=A0ABQ5HW19_9ASTR
MENYNNVSQDIQDQLNAEVESVQIILTGIDNDIYSTVVACPNACEMWKSIERLKQGESINIQDLKTNLYWEFGKFTSRDILTSTTTRMAKGKSVETKFDKPSVVRQPNAQRIPKPSVLGKPTPFSNSLKMRSFQTKQSVNKTNVSDGLFKQVTQQNFPKIRKQAVRNTNVIAPGPSRNHPKHLSFQSPKEFVGSNYMVHNYYLEKAKKSAQLQKDRDVNGKPSMINLLEVSKPANWLQTNLGIRQASLTVVGFQTKMFTYANHDECVLEYLSKLNPRASAQNKDAKSHKTTKRYMPVEKTRESKRPERQIPSGHRFSKKKTTTVPEKTMTPRSCLSEPMHGSIVDNPHIHACKQTLSLSADLAPQRQEMSVENVTSGLILEFKTTSMEQSCSKAGSKSCSLSKQDSYITTSVGITIPPSHSNVEDNKWFRLESSYDPTRSGGIYRRISNVRKLQSLVMTSLIRVNTILQNHMMIAGIENDIMVPVIAMHNTFPGLLGVSQQITFVSFVSEYLRYLLTDQSRDR